jgi:hypothetical protein
MVASFVAPGLNVLIEANVPSRSSRPLWRIAPGCWPKVEEDVARSEELGRVEGGGQSQGGLPLDGSPEAPRPANNCVPVAPRLLTLTDHPGFDLVVVFIRMGDRADGRYSRSGLMMEVAPVHDTLRNAKSNALRTTAVPQSRREPLPLIVRFRRGATLLF